MSRESSHRNRSLRLPGRLSFYIGPPAAAWHRTKILSILLTFSFALTCIAFTGDESLFLQGRVLECGTDAPLPGVTVKSGQLTTNTDPRGTFILSPLSAGVHELVFTIEGFYELHRDWDLSHGSKSDVMVKLLSATGNDYVCIPSPARSVNVLIVDSESGKPVPFAAIMPYKKCTGLEGQITLTCVPLHSFEASVEVRADGYERWRHKIHIPGDKGKITIAISRKK